MRVFKLSAWIGLSAGLTLAVNSPARAQSTEDQLQADALHARANQLQTGLSNLSEAARLHAQEVELRSSFDPSAVDCLNIAANLFIAAKRPLDARRAMESAGDRALALGDIQRAALLYVNAAFIADGEKNVEETTRLGRKADLLTASPLLADAQKTDLHRRIHHPANVAKTEKERMAQRADSLHGAAITMQAQDGRLAEAARLYKEEVKLRPRDDPGAVDALLLAANLLSADNRPLEARRTLEDAGDRALGAGDVERGARAFIEAAVVADRDGNKEEVRRLAHRAELLAISPQLTPEQRQEISRRIRRLPFASTT